MGSVCSRRSAQPTVLVEQEGWLLIPPVPRPTFKTAVRRVIVLLALRQEWSQQGRRFELEPEARDTRPRRLRQRKLARIGRMLEQRKALFDHVVRRRGVSQYK